MKRRAAAPVGVALIYPGFSSGYFAMVLLSANKCTCIDITVGTLLFPFYPSFSFINALFP